MEVGMVIMVDVLVDVGCEWVLWLVVVQGLTDGMKAAK